MKLFKREIEPKITDVMFKGKMIAIMGPRQSGKTTLAKKILEPYGDQGVYHDCQLADVRKHFVPGEPDKLLPLTERKKIVVFDEAQTIQDIGSLLKAYHDTYPDVQVVATGSSSFDLSNKIKEPMTGRVHEFLLLPLSVKEAVSISDTKTIDLMTLMQFGSYPAVVAAETTDQKLLAIKSIATNYLYKDVFVFEAIRSPRVFEDLVKLLAHQVGSLVSVNELSQSLGVSRATVNRYLTLLEQSFIIRRVYSFSRNPRNEIKKGFKVFFLDTGVRNALVDINSPMDGRNDRGAIFENFFVSERLKQGTLNIFPPEILFWRSRTGEEIDVVEKDGQKLAAFECKWSGSATVPHAFSRTYPEASFVTVTPDTMVSSLVP